MIKILSKKRKREHEFSTTHVLIPNNIAKLILNWSNINVPEHDLYYDPDDGSLGREDEIHVTVKYGLHTNNPDEIKKIVSGFGPVTLKLGKMHLFKSSHNDVLVIKIESSDLKELNALISDNLEYTDSHPVYIPHLTIAYLKKGTGDKFSNSDRFEGDEAEIKEIEFVSKQSDATIIKL